jgi:transposase
VERKLDLSVEVVHRTPKPTPERSLGSGQRLLLRRGFEVLTRRWVVELTFAWLSQNRRMSIDYESLCSTSESFVHAARARLIKRARISYSCLIKEYPTPVVSTEKMR